MSCDRWGSFFEIGSFYFGLDPLLGEAMDNAREVLAKHLAQLAFNLALDKFLDDGYRIKCGVDVDVLEGVGFENQGDALLFGYDEDDVGV
jgi:hypothetical protein